MGSGGGDRVEHDSLGDVSVRADALYGAHTARAVDNFSVSGDVVRNRPALVAALGHVKAAATRANVQLGEIDARTADAIVTAAREIASGRHDTEFPIDLVHGGGGTALNMNANEVIANRAGELLGDPRGSYTHVHPNDHVNRSQSTNDVFPTALALATVVVGRRAIEQLEQLATRLDDQADAAGSQARLGRTCLQDAVPLTVEETHRTHAHSIRRTTAALGRAVQERLAVPLGATIIGTGVGAPDGYRDLAVRFLAEESELEVRISADPFDALANADGYIDVGTQAVRVAVAMAKIATDLRLLSMPGIGEVRLPAVQVGSSIMPGKVNPVIPELVMQVSYEVRGMATIVDCAVAAGELELNVMEPVISRHLLAGLADLGQVAEIFAERCIAGLVWKTGAVDGHLARSRADSVKLAREIGYATVAGMAGDRTQPTDR